MKNILDFFSKNFDHKIALSLIMSFIIGVFVLMFHPTFAFGLCVLSVILVITYFKPGSVILLLGYYLLFNDYIVSQVGKFSLLGMLLDRSEEAIILVCLCSFPLKLLLSKKKFITLRPLDFLLIMLIIVSILSSLINHFAPLMESFIDLVLLLKGFLVLYIFLNIEFSVEQLNNVIKVIFSIGLLNLIVGIFNVISPSFFVALIHSQVPIQYRFGLPSAQAFFIHPGRFGWFMGFLFCFCVSFYFVQKNKKGLLLGLLFFFGLIISFRFKPIMGAFLALCITVFLLPSKIRLKYFISLIIFLFIIGVLFGPFIYKLAQNKIYYYLNNSQINNVARTMLYKTSLLISRDFFPLGAGLGTFGGWVSVLRYSPLYSRYNLTSVFGLDEGGKFIMDTFWPYLIAETGYFGFLIYCIILCYLFIRLVHIFKKSNNLLLRTLTLGTIMIFWEALAESVAVSFFVKPAEYFYFFMSIGIIFSMWQKEQKDNFKCSTTLR